MLQAPATQGPGTLAPGTQDFSQTMFLEDSTLMDGGADEAAGDTTQVDIEDRSLLGQAMRLLVADTWDSEAEEATKRAPPDLVMLESAWCGLEEAFDAKAAIDIGKASSGLDAEESFVVDRMDTKADELRQRFDSKAQASTFKPEDAEKYRNKSFEIMDSAHHTRQRNARAKKVRLASYHRKMQGKKESIRRALGPQHHELAAASFVPDSNSLEDLSSADAMRMVADSTWTVLRAVEVVALRPMRGNQNLQAWGTNKENAVKLSARQDARLLHEACGAVTVSLTTSIEALLAKLKQEAENTPAPEKDLENVARGDEGLNKEQRREKLMFEGQQEVEWERKISAKVKIEVKRATKYGASVLEKVEVVLRRRFQRRYNRYRTETLTALSSLSRAVADAETALDIAWQNQQDKAAGEAQELEQQRRSVHGQHRLLIGAAMIIKEEKARMAKAYQASDVKQKQKLMKKSLKRVHGLHNTIRTMEVVPDLKQNHSVLLYSLRMLEARLNSEVPASNLVSNEVEEATFDETLADSPQLQEVDIAFEETLAKELTALNAKHYSRGKRVVAKMAQELITSVSNDHGAAIPKTREGLDLTLQACTLADFAAEAIRPLATLAQEISPEAIRHVEVVNSPGDASTLRPKHKWLHSAVQNTVDVLTDMRKLLRQSPPAVTVRWRDIGWEGALEATEQQWQVFFDAHPLGEAGPDTPREDNDPSSPQSNNLSPTRNEQDGGAKQELRNALMEDDIAPTPSRAKPKAPKLGGPPAPGRAPPQANLDRLLPGKAAVPRANVGTTSPNGAKKKPGAGKKEEMKAMLAQLDQMGKKMDAAMGKTDDITTQVSSAALNAAPPPPVAAKARNKK